MDEVNQSYNRYRIFDLLTQLGALLWPEELAQSFLYASELSLGDQTCLKMSAYYNVHTAWGMFP